MKGIDKTIRLMFLMTLSVNLLLLFIPSFRAYLFWVNLFTGSSFLAALFLIIYRKKWLKKLKNTSLENPYNRN